MDIDDIYNDLDNFQVEEVKNSELLALEAKYQESLTTIDQLKAENADLQKKVKTMQVNFQNLLDTAKAEIRRKDKQIAELRMEKDDLCFRRKQPKHAGAGADGGVVYAQQFENFHVHATTLPSYNYTTSTIGMKQQEHNAWVPATTNQQSSQLGPHAAAAIEPSERSSRGRTVERPQRAREHHTDRDKHSSCDSRDRRERSSSRHKRGDALKRKRGHYESESSSSTYEKSERGRGREEQRQRDLRKDSSETQHERIRSRRKSQEKYKNVYDARRSRHSSYDKRESVKHEQQSGRDDERRKSAYERKDTVRFTETEKKALEADFKQNTDSTRSNKEKYMPKNDDQQYATRQEQHSRKSHERDKTKQHKEQKMVEHLKRKSDNTSGEITEIIPKIDGLQQRVDCVAKVAPLVDGNSENGVREISAAGNIAEHVAATEITAKVALSQTDENSNVTRTLEPLNTPTKAALYDSLFGKTPSSVESVSSNLLTNVMSLLQSGSGSRDSTATSPSVCTENADTQVQQGCADVKQLVEQYFVENAAASGAKQINSAATLVGISDLSDIASEYIPGLGDSPLCKRTSLKRRAFGFLVKQNEVIEIGSDTDIDATDEERNDKVLMVAAEGGNGNGSCKSVHDDSNGKPDIVILEDIQLPHIFKLQERETELCHIKEINSKSEKHEKCGVGKYVDMGNQQTTNDEERVPILLSEAGTQQSNNLHKDNENPLNEEESIKPTNNDGDATMDDIVSSSEASKVNDKSACKPEVGAGAKKECVESEVHISVKSETTADKQNGASVSGQTEIAVAGQKFENSSTAELVTFDAERESASANKEESSKDNLKDAENVATADIVSERGANVATSDNDKSIKVGVDAEKTVVNASDLASSQTLEKLKVAELEVLSAAHNSNVLDSDKFLTVEVEHTLSTNNFADDATVQLIPHTSDNDSVGVGIKDVKNMTAAAKLPRNDVDRKTAEFETANFEQCVNFDELPADGKKSTNNFTAESENSEKRQQFESPNNVDDCNANKELKLTPPKECLSEMGKTEERRGHVKSKAETDKISNFPVAHSACTIDEHSNIKSTEREITDEAMNCVETAADSKPTSDSPEVSIETQPQIIVKSNEGKESQQIVDRTLEMAANENEAQSANTENVKECISVLARKQPCHQSKVFNNANENGLETLLAAAQLHENAKQSPPATEAEIADTLIKLKNSTPSGADVKTLEDSAEKQESAKDVEVGTAAAQIQANKETNTPEKAMAQRHELQHGQGTFSSIDEADIEDAVSYIVHSVSCQAPSGTNNSLEKVDTKLIETPMLKERTQDKSRLEPTKRTIEKPAEKRQQKLEAEQIEKTDKGIGRRKKKVTPALVQRKGKFLNEQKAQNAGIKVSGKVDKKKDKPESEIGVEIVDQEKLDNKKCKSVKAADLKMDDGLNTLKALEMKGEKVAIAIQQPTEPASTFKPLPGQSEKVPVVLPTIKCLSIEQNEGLQAISKFKIPKRVSKKVEQNEVSSVAADKQVENSNAKRQIPRLKAHDEAEHTKVKTLKRAAGAKQLVETVQIPSELLETRTKLQLTVTEVNKQMQPAHNVCEERDLETARIVNAFTERSEVANSLPEPTIELLEEKKAVLKRKLSECYLDVSSDEELFPSKPAWRALKRRRCKMRVLDTDDEFVEESCTQAQTMLKPSAANSRQVLPEKLIDSGKGAQRETQTAEKLETEPPTIIEITSNLTQSQTAQLSGRMAEIQVNSENAAKKKTKTEAAKLAAELNEKIASQTETEMNVSFSSDNCNQPTFMSPTFSANTSQDECYREIDSRLQSMFASPPSSAIDFQFRPEASTTRSALASDFNVSETFVGDVSGRSVQTAELTVDETNRLEQSGSNLEANSTLDDSTAGTKNISLGLSDYRFEKVSDNVVNLFITRKRRGKRPRAELEHTLATTTAS